MSKSVERDELERMLCTPEPRSRMEALSPRREKTVNIKNLITRESLLSEMHRMRILKSGKATQLDRIAMELLETERVYVNDLSEIIEGYLKFLLACRKKLRLTAEDILASFGCVEQISFFNRCLLHQLDGAIFNVAQIAKCFLVNSEGFTSYVTYCMNYKRMLGNLAKIMEDDEVAKALKYRQLALGHTLPLSSFLLKPVQRVLKYHLFMENLYSVSLKTESFSGTERAVIKQARNCMNSQARKINDEMERIERWEIIRDPKSALLRWCADRSEDFWKCREVILSLVGPDVMNEGSYSSEVQLVAGTIRNKDGEYENSGAGELQEKQELSSSNSPEVRIQELDKCNVKPTVESSIKALSTSFGGDDSASSYNELSFHTIESVPVLTEDFRQRTHNRLSMSCRTKADFDRATLNLMTRLLRKLTEFVFDAV